MSWLGRKAAITPYPPPLSTTRAIAAQISRRRRFFPFVPANPLPLLAMQSPTKSFGYQDVRNPRPKVPQCSHGLRRGQSAAVAKLQRPPPAFPGLPAGSSFKPRQDKKSNYEDFR